MGHEVSDFSVEAIGRSRPMGRREGGLLENGNPACEGHRLSQALRDGRLTVTWMTGLQAAR